MARGRMITNKITRDKAINGLSDDTSRLAFTWLITFADREGRVFGDPALIRSALFPRRDDITNKRMEQYVTEWATSGLVVWYEIGGDEWIWFPKFDKNQPGLRKEREPSSDIPAFMPDTCQILAGCLPTNCLIKGMEENGKEENGMEDEQPSRPPIFTLYEQNIGTLAGMMIDELKDAEKTYPAEWIPLAFKEAVDHNARSWKYVLAVLKNWKEKGFPTNGNGKNGNGHKPALTYTNAAGQPTDIFGHTAEEQ